MNKICFSCNEKNNPSFVNCWKCGHSLSDLPQNPPNAINDNVKLKKTRVIDKACLVGFVVSFFQALLFENQSEAFFAARLGNAIGISFFRGLMYGLALWIIWRVGQTILQFGKDRGGYKDEY